jgi:Zn-dependent protease with chaperone function
MSLDESDQFIEGSVGWHNVDPIGMVATLPSYGTVSPPASEVEGSRMKTNRPPAPHTGWVKRVSRGPETKDVRRLSRSRILLDLPSFALSAIVVGFLANALGFLPWGWIIVAAWLLSGPLVLIRRVEEAVIGGMANMRKPTAEESQRLASSWRNVTQAAEIDPSRYSLWVQRTRQVNAFATAGHTVAVTEAAAARLSGEQLEGVLAHELGHHMGGHAWASLLRYWYSLPGSYALGFGTYLSLALTSAFDSGSMPMAIVISLVLLGFVVFLIVHVPLLGTFAGVF